MNTTSLHMKIEPAMKKQAQEIADELGLSLTAVVKALLKQFIRTKRLTIGIHERPEIPNARTRKILKQAEEDIKAGNTISFKNNKEALAFLDTLIDHDKQTSQ
jgi:addiction module RelB/DinJ family antitoxin